MLGHKVGGLRLPLIEADEHELAEVRAMLVRHDLLPVEKHADGERKAATSVRATGA
jgi:hypothetical protein